MIVIFLWISPGSRRIFQIILFFYNVSLVNLSVTESYFWDQSHQHEQPKTFKWFLFGPIFIWRQKWNFVVAKKVAQMKRRIYVRERYKNIDWDVVAEHETHWFVAEMSMLMIMMVMIMMTIMMMIIMGKVKLKDNVLEKTSVLYHGGEELIGRKWRW